MVVNRLSYTDLLNALSRINRATEKKDDIKKSRSLNEVSGKNWQEEAQVCMTSLPKAATIS